VDAAVKETLLDQFRCYLDSIEDAPEEPREEPDDGGAEADLFTVFVELAAVRNEVRTESRLVKEALDQFRGVFATLQSSHATLEQELKRVHAEARERGRALLRPLLLELLDLRDRLAAGLQQPTTPPPRRFDRWRRRQPAEPESWREGLGITLRRLDRILAERRVVRIEMAGRPFDPRTGRVVGTTQDTSVGAGIVVDEVSAGFVWDDELLRAAEVIVNKVGAEQEETV
jgi:molecular chaperone GrpE